MARNPEFQALAEAIEAARIARGITQGCLGQRVAEIEGRDRPYTQGDVADWVTRDRAARKPRLIFAIEQALELEPGSLSQILGFLPLTARDIVTVEDALRFARLDERDRAAVLDLYNTLREG